MAESDVDDGVASLPKETLKRIDEAFDRAILESVPEDERPQKRRRLSQDAEPELSGGFLLDDDNLNAGTVAGGGFVVEDDEQAGPSTNPTHIPLSLIPHALQLLDFNPSDSQILSVFSNAAFPPSMSASEVRKRRTFSQLSDDEPEHFVCRSDWRAVCAALIPVDGPLSSDNDDGDSRSILESDMGSSDRVQSAELEESGSSSDEYVPESNTKRSSHSREQRPRGASSATKSKSKPKSDSKGSSPSTPDPSTSASRPLTARQEQETLDAFTLFFPSRSKSKGKGSRTDLSEAELSKKRLTIREIANAAASIREKLTAEEIIEMLSFFSSSSSQTNPSLSFHEFQQMMIAAKLA